MISRRYLKGKEVAWIAGFFDGEGTISLKRNRPRPHKRMMSPTYALQIQIGNTYLPALEKVKNVFDGYINPHKGNYLSKRKIWVWRTASKNAERTLQILLPYLVIKKAQAEIALLSRKYVLKGQRGILNPNLEKLEDFKNQISRLNQGEIH